MTADPANSEPTCWRRYRALEHWGLDPEAVGLREDVEGEKDQDMKPLLPPPPKEKKELEWTRMSVVHGTSAGLAKGGLFGAGALNFNKLRDLVDYQAEVAPEAQGRGQSGRWATMLFTRTLGSM